MNSLVQLQLLLTLLVTITNLENPSLIIITSILGYIEEVDIINLRVCSIARVGTSLKIKEREDGNYIIENFKELLQDWFWGD